MPWATGTGEYHNTTWAWTSEFPKAATTKEMSALDFKMAQCGGWRLDMSKLEQLNDCNLEWLADLSLTHLPKSLALEIVKFAKLESATGGSASSSRRPDRSAVGGSSSSPRRLKSKSAIGGSTLLEPMSAGSVALRARYVCPCLLSRSPNKGAIWESRCSPAPLSHTPNAQMSQLQTQRHMKGKTKEV